MMVHIEPFEHYCTSEQDCGEVVSQAGASVRAVRKWVWIDEKGKRSRLFASEEDARADAGRRGYEVAA